MKLSTRILSIIMAFAMIVSSMVVVASAEDTAATGTFVVTPTLSEDGKSVAVAIELISNPGIVGLTLELDYDSTMFELASVEEEDEPVLAGSMFYEDVKNEETDETEQVLRVTGDPCVLNWFDWDRSIVETGSNNTNTGVIATVNFDVVGELAAGDYEFAVECTEAPTFELGNAVDEFAPATGTLEVEAVTTVTITTEKNKETVVVDYTIELDQTQNIDLNPGELTTNVAGSENWTRKWTSSDVQIATVTIDGGIVQPTGIKDGEVDIILTYYDANGEEVASGSVKVNVTFTEGYEPPVDPSEPEEPVGDPVAKIGDTPYYSVADALAAATAGQTVTMIADSTENVIMINPGVTLDIGTNTLTADYVVGLKGSVLKGGVYSNSTGAKYGKLVAPKENVLLNGDNATTVASGKTYKVLPFWNGTDAYLFSIYDIYSITSAYYNAEQIYLEFSHQASKACRTDYFNNGIADNALEMTVTLTWSGPTGDYNQTYVFNENTIQEMSPSGTSARYYFILKGYEKLALDPTDFTMSVVLRSTTGLEVTQEASVSAQ